MPSGAVPTGAGGGSAKDDKRPSYRIATFGLAYRFRRLLEIIVRHSRHNPYRFVLTEDEPPATTYDIALVDMTAKGGVEIARTLRGKGEAPSVIGVGRRQHHARGSDDLLMRSFSLDVLTVLNRAAAHLAHRQQVDSTPLPTVSLASVEPLVGVAGVLVIEPSPSSRSQVVVALRQIGARAEAVGTLAAAATALAARHHDLIVMELDLPDGNGMDLIRRLHADGRGPAVIILSRRCGWLDLGRAALAGCAGFLEKPTEPAILQATARRALIRVQRRGDAGAPPTRRDGIAKVAGSLTALAGPLRRRLTERTVR